MPGSYGDLTSRECKPCPRMCETCKATSSEVVCTSCPHNKQLNFLNGNVCVQYCPGGMAYSNYVRLSGNFSSPYQGLLEIKYRGAWHTVCDDGFDLNTARVFCRELGYGQPIKYLSREYGQGRGKIIAQAVSCKGDERSFIECHQAEWFAPGCSHYEDIGLWCQPPKDGYVVTSQCMENCPPGTYPNSDKVCELCNQECLTCSKQPENCESCRVNFFHNGTACTTTCPEGMYANETLRMCVKCSPECLTCIGRADICLSCKYPLLHNGTSCKKTCPILTYRKEFSCVKDCGLRHYAMDNVCRVCPLKCLVCASGTVCNACEHGYVLTLEGKCEQSCAFGQFWTSVLPEDVGINLPVRLTSVESFKYKGRLEVKHNGVWGSVCDDGWSAENAKVACKQLMLGPPLQIVYLRQQSYNELNISRIWLDDVNCHGSEESLADCKSRKWGQNNCVHGEDVHIECASPGLSTCKTECPPAYYKNKNNCSRCFANCLNCSGTATNCTLCMSGYFLTNTSECMKNCPPGFYETSDRHCKACHSHCQTCKGDGKNLCTSCKKPDVLVSNQCFAHCPENSYKQRANPYISLWKKVGPYEGVVKVSVFVTSISPSQA